MDELGQILTNVTKALLEEMNSASKDPRYRIRITAGIAEVHNDRTGEVMQVQLCLVRDKDLMTRTGEVRQEKSVLFDETIQN